MMIIQLHVWYFVVEKSNLQLYIKSVTGVQLSIVGSLFTVI